MSSSAFGCELFCLRLLYFTSFRDQLKLTFGSLDGILDVLVKLNVFLVSL